MRTFAVILAGGRGERFWPQSRRDFPKQFLKLFGRQSLVQMTAQRIAPICPMPAQRFVIDPALGRVLGRQLALRPANFIREPYGRNTAPAIALAAAYVAAEEPDSTLVVLPADHLIRDVKVFREQVRFAVEVAQEGYLVTFGVPPARPDTNYGYIEAGALLHKEGTHQAFAVKRFLEKPNLARARAFLRKGGFWWNSGMFVWRADVFLRAVELLMPGLHAELATFKGRIGTREEGRALTELYSRVESNSVDSAIMEKAGNVAAVRADFDWDDVGSWSALERQFACGPEGNVAVGDSVAQDSRGCMSLTDEGIVAMIGCEDLVVVRSGNAVLVCRRERAGEIKQLLARMAEKPELSKYL